MKVRQQMKEIKKKQELEANINLNLKKANDSN